MARSEGLEPPTPWFEAKYSIQLSYERIEALHCCDYATIYDAQKV